MKKIVALLVCLAALAFPSKSHAFRFGGWEFDQGALVTSPVVQDLVSRGKSYWNRPDTCPEGVIYEFSVTRVSPEGPEIPPAGFGGGSLGCDILLRADWWRVAPAYALCILIFHEVGHSIGLDHTLEGSDQDPLNVMANGYEVFTTGVPSQCPSEAGQAPIAATETSYRAPEKVIVTKNPDGKTRSWRSAYDRSWCRRNSRICYYRYERLASAALSRRRFNQLVDLDERVRD